MHFNTLMKKVKYVGHIPQCADKPYSLRMGSRSYFFKDTSEIVPFVTHTLGIRIVMPGESDGPEGKTKNTSR